MIEGLAQVLGPESLKEVPVPQFKHQESPDAGRVVTTASEVFVEELTDPLWIEVPPLQGSWF